MTKKKRKHKLRYVRAAMQKQPWYIHGPAFAEMAEVLTLDASGHELTPDLIQARMGYQSEDSRMEVVNGFAVIPITGLIQSKANAITRYYGGTATDRLEMEFRKAITDSQIKGVVFLVDSPGGAALGCEEAAQTIFGSRGVKPITAFVRGLCASAAYYIASAADRIVASPSSTVGSIGTIYTHMDASKYYEDWGLNITPITFGKHKADGNQFEPLSAQGRQTLQKYVDGYGEQFVAAVARHRNVTPKIVMEQFGQGQTFLADEARQRGLIDQVGTIEQAMQMVESQRADSGDGDGEEPESRTVFLTPGWTPEQEAAFATAAADNDRPSNESAAHADSTSNRSPIMDKIRAALFARGMIDSMDASEEVCKAVLAGYFKGNVPENEQQVLDALNGAQQSEASAESANSSGPAANVQAAHDRELAEAKAEAVQADRERRENIEAAGHTLGMSDEAIKAAVDSEDSHETVIAAWHKKLAAKEPPVNTTSVTVTERSDQFAVDAIDGMLMRAGYSPASETPSSDAQRLQNAPLIRIAQQCLQLAGARVDPYAQPEDVALMALQMSGHDVVVVSAAGPAYNRPGDFPNLLSNLAGKILDQAIQIAEPTYPRWTAKLADLPDFKPKTVIGVGHFDELDQLTDDEDPPSLKFSEEAAGWIEAGRFGNKVGLTPVMVANDDLDAFSTALVSLAVAHEHTLNRLCLSLITGNVTLPDGNSLFDDTNHGNDVTSGGAPSTAQANTMRLKHRRQTGIGGVGKVRTPPRIALVPPAHEEAAMQTFLSFSRLNESKLPVTDATINTFRGSIEPITEPDLEDSSTAIWYTFCDPRIRRVIVHAFQRGYGRGGKRTRWFDPARETQYVKLEGRFAAAACGHRGAVRNAGA